MGALDLLLNDNALAANPAAGGLATPGAYAVDPGMSAQPSGGMLALPAPEPQPAQPPADPSGMASMMITPDDAIRAAAKAHPWVTGLRVLGASLQDVGAGLGGREGGALDKTRASIYQDQLIPARMKMLGALMSAVGGGDATAGFAPGGAGGQPGGAMTQADLQLRALQQRDGLMQKFVAAGIMSPEQYNALRPQFSVQNGQLLDERTGRSYGHLGASLTAGPSGQVYDTQDPSNAGVVMPKPPVDGAVPYFGPQGAQGGVAGWRLPDGTTQVIGQTSQAQAAGTAAGTASVTDPVTIQTIPDPNNPGATKVVSNAQLRAMASGQGGGGAPPAVVPPPAVSGAAPGGLGGTAGAADTAFAGDQAKDLSAHITELSNAREGAVASRLNATQAIAFAKSHPMNPATPGFVAGANYLRALPPAFLKGIGYDPAKADQLANDASVFNRITNMNTLSSAKTLLPARYTERELKLIPPITGSLTTPNEAMGFSAAMQGATAGRMKAQADFAANYTGPKNRAAFEKAWADSPAGKRSLFQDPEMWSGVTFHGKPAVQYATVKGQQIGVFGYGTPFQYVFRVR